MAIPLRKEFQKPRVLQFNKPREEKIKDFLTEDEVHKLMKESLKDNNGPSHRYMGLRNAIMILMAFRHGLRNSECINMTWDQIDLDNERISVWRLKNGLGGIHPLFKPTPIRGQAQAKKIEGHNEAVFLRRLLKETEKRGIKSHYVFVNSFGEPLHRTTFNTTMRNLSVKCGFPFTATVRMLRHGSGGHHINNGQDIRFIQDFLGHVKIDNTVRYTRLKADRFENWF